MDNSVSNVARLLPDELLANVANPSHFLHGINIFVSMDEIDSSSVMTLVIPRIPPCRRRNFSDHVAPSDWETLAVKNDKTFLLSGANADFGHFAASFFQVSSATLRSGSFTERIGNSLE